MATVFTTETAFSTCMTKSSNLPAGRAQVISSGCIPVRTRLRAQPTLAGNIAGGTAGNGLDGVCVIAISDASGQTFIARTGLNGNYGVPNIGPGVYTIEILPVCSGSMAYAPVVVSNVILQSDQVTTLSEVLSPTAS